MFQFLSDDFLPVVVFIDSGTFLRGFTSVTFLHGHSLWPLPPEPFLRDLLHLLMMSRMYDFSTAKSILITI